MQNNLFFERALIHPQGNRLGYEILPYNSQTKQFIQNSKLSKAAQEVLIGLLEWGNVMEFPGGIGLDYKAPFKTLYISKFTKQASLEIADKVQNSKANCLVAPDISALFWAKDIADADGNLPILRVQKDNKQTKQDYQGSLSSYTKGTKDILYFDTDTLRSTLKFNHNKLRFFLADEIADTGKMLQLLSNIIQQMKHDGINAEVVGAGVIIEKTFTGVAQMLQKECNLPLYSALKITDTWLANDSTPAAITVEGIEGKAFSFAS